MSLESRTSKEARLAARVQPEVKRLLERAATLKGQSLSAFMVSHLTEAARKIVDDHERLALSRRDQEAFFEALMNPPEPNARLKAAARRHRSQGA